MSRRLATWLAPCLWLAACGGPPAPWATAPATGIDLRLEVAPKEAALMQPVTATIDLFVRDGLDVAFAPQVAAADFVVTTHAEPAVPLLGGQWRRTVLTLKPRRGPGPLQLPSFRASVKGGELAASTPETTIVVTSSLVDEGQGEPELDVEAKQRVETFGEPFAAPTEFPGWWAAVVAAALLLGGGLWWWLRPRARRHAVAVALPPHVRARRELERLRATARTTPAEIEAFYVAVSAVLRNYLEERFGLRAPERTTEEFLRELEGGDVLAREHRAELERFLAACDLVKFAAVVPGEAEHSATWQLAATFVDATRADRPAPPPATAVAEVVR